MFNITVEALFSARTHYGHRPRNWNPKLKDCIYGKYNGIYIINLDKTIAHLREAFAYIEDQVAGGKNVLFVGTKRVAAASVKEHAMRCSMPYVCSHWLGGTLTNFQTISQSIRRLNSMRESSEHQKEDVMSKRERLSQTREYEKLRTKFEGLKDMTRPPGILFIVDVGKERIAVLEANKLDIPVVGMVDTDCSTEGISHAIVANDDAAKSVDLCVSAMADAVILGQERWRKARDEQLGVSTMLLPAVTADTAASTGEPPHSVQPVATVALTTPPAVQPEATVALTTPPAVQPEVAVAPTSPPAVQPEATVALTTPPAVQPEVAVAPTSPPAVQPEATVALTTPPAVQPEAGTVNELLHGAQSKESTVSGQEDKDSPPQEQHPKS